jgi:glycine betaine/proline transport system substrate-binding protein
VLTLGAFGVVAAQDGEETVRMARASWDTGFFQAEIFQQLISELGYDVELTGTIAAQNFYPAVAEGEDVDLWANGWLPLHETFLTDEDVLGRAIPVGFEVENGALQGYLVDVATADEYGITSIMDMTDPEIAELFDTDGDGRANLTGCNPGWGCEAAINGHLDTLDLEDSIQHVQGQYSLLMAETINRYERGEPIFFYTWTPNWTVNELTLGEDVYWINVPAEEVEVEPVEGLEGCVTPESCSLGFEANDIRAVANVDFLRENPAIAALLTQIEIPLEDIAAQNEMMQEGADSEEDIEEQASNWIDENSDQVEEWLAFAEENADNTELVEEAINEWMSEVEGEEEEMESE